MISKKLIDEAIGRAEKNHVDFAEIFVEDTEKIEMKIKNSELQNVIQKDVSGIGIRVINGGQEFYASTNDLSRNNVLSCIDELSQIRNKKNRAVISNIYENSGKELYNKTTEVNGFIRKNMAFAGEIDRVARQYHQIQGSASTIWSTIQNVTIANTNGVYRKDRRERARSITNIIAYEDGAFQESVEVRGSLGGWEYLQDMDAEMLGKDYAQKAIGLLKADQCPTGKMPIVIAGGLGGSFFHEACGHLLEASCIVHGNSEFSGKLGERVASPLVTLIDDGTINGAWGTNTVDDEGTPCRKNILIEKGILKDYMVDYINSIYIERPMTGNARRENYRYMPTARMTNTYIAAGNDREEEIISSVGYGIFVEEFKGGSVNPVTGEFNVGILRGFLIKNGKKDRWIKGGTLIGNGSDIMKKIDKVGRKLIWSQGMCGAKSGLIPVGTGQPMIRIKEGVIGGN